MEREGSSGELSSFWVSGIYRLSGSSNAVFMDPVRVLSSSYARYSLRPSCYYSRPFRSPGRGAALGPEGDEQASASSCVSRKRKRKKKKKRAHDLNERERAAEQRHQEARPFLLKAHGSFLQATELLSILPAMTRGGQSPGVDGEASEVDFIELGSLWQTSQYEITLCFPAQGTQFSLCCARTVMPLFSNSVSNETDDDLEAEFLNNQYILPRKSCFHTALMMYGYVISAAHSDYGYNLIVMDPPWENASACQKSLYPTLPSRYFLYIPIRQLAHTQGALVALWVTNREKLRMFVEEELFPSWGVTDVSVFYWLKVKTDGSMVGDDLDLFHHRPYECLILGYVNGKGVDSGHVITSLPQNNQVIISIPGAYSRKPPVGKLLLDYVPGPKPANCLELFARELVSGWTSWGNEPLHFQDSRYFVDKSTEQGANDGSSTCP